MSIRLRPPLARVTKALRGARPLDRVALHSETVAPAETASMPPVIMDDAARARVTAAQPETTLAREWQRIDGYTATHDATVRHVLRDVLATPWGFFTGGGAYRQFGHPPLRALASLPIRHEPRGFYATAPICTKYFGHWLLDGLPSTLLARPGEALYFPHAPGWHHAAEYLRLLDIAPLPDTLVHFDEMTVCDDIGQNADRRARQAEIQRRLQHAVPSAGHSKVHIVRGATGARRRLANEEDLARALAAEGFAVVHASEPLETLLSACAMARTVVSVEGSHAMHALFPAARGALHVTLNPADRFNNLFADYMPGLGARLATTVIDRDGADYRVDIAGLMDFLGRIGALD